MDEEERYMYDDDDIMYEQEEDIIHAERSSTMGMEILETLDESIKNMPDSTANVKQMLVHHGYLYLEVWKGDLASMAGKVEALATEDGRGYLESRSFSNNSRYGSEKSLEVQFRVQSRNFHEIVAAIQELVGQDLTMNVDVNSRDVTDSYIDASARADTLDASRKALRTLLEKATNVREIMDVQRELNALTQQYESQRKRAIHLKKEAVSIFICWDM